jgi:hypothetical protein
MQALLLLLLPIVTDCDNLCTVDGLLQRLTELTSAMFLTCTAMHVCTYKLRQLLLLLLLLLLHTELSVLHHAYWHSLAMHSSEKQYQFKQLYMLVY